jgi:hypothetical protein
MRNSRFVLGTGHFFTASSFLVETESFAPETV